MHACVREPDTLHDALCRFLIAVVLAIYCCACRCPCRARAACDEEGRCRRERGTTHRGAPPVSRSRHDVGTRTAYGEGAGDQGPSGWRGLQHAAGGWVRQGGHGRCRLWPDEHAAQAAGAAAAPAGTKDTRGAPRRRAQVPAGVHACMQLLCVEPLGMGLGWDGGACRAGSPSNHQPIQTLPHFSPPPPPPGPSGTAGCGCGSTAPGKGT